MNFDFLGHHKKNHILVNTQIWFLWCLWGISVKEKFIESNEKYQSLNGKIF